MRRGRVFHDDGDVFDAVPVRADVARDLIVGAQTAGEYEAQFVLLQNVRSAIHHAGFGARVSDLLETKGRTVIVSGLLGVTHIEFKVGPIDVGQRMGLLREERTHMLHLAG